LADFGLYPDSCQELEGCASQKCASHEQELNWKITETTAEA